MYHSPITIFLYCLLFVFLSWHRLNWALAFLVLGLATYLTRFTIGFVPFTLLEAMIWIIFIVWLIRNYKKPIITAYRWPILILFLISVIAIEISPNTIGALGIWKAYFLEPIMFFLVFINVIKNKKDLQLIIYALGVSALAVSIFAIYQKFTGWAIPNEFWAAKETRRVTSFFGYPNAIGLYLGPIIILYAGQLLLNYKKILPVIFNSLVIIVSLLSIVFAVSKGALVGVFAGLLFLGILFSKKTRLVTIVAAITLAVIIFFTPNLYQRIIKEVSFQSMSGQVRTQMWGETWQMLQDHFVFGAGLAGYQQTFDPYHPERYIEVYLYPHNIILNFWSELGLAGLFWFIYIFIKFFKDGWQIFKRVEPRQERGETPPFVKGVGALTLMAIMVTIIIHGLVDVPYFKNDLAVMFWLWLGMMTTLQTNN